MGDSTAKRSNRQNFYMKVGQIAKNDIKLPPTLHENAENNPKVGRNSMHFSKPE